MFSIGPNLSEQYFGLADEVNALAKYSAVAPNIQSTNALATWATDQVGPTSDHNLLKNNVVLLDDQGNMEGLSSSKYIPKPAQSDPDTVYINQANGHLYRGTSDLEALGSGNVIAPLVQTTTALPTWSASANTLTNSTVLLDNTGNITQASSLKMIPKTSVSDPDTVYINSSNNHLYRGTTDLELTGTGDVLAPPVTSSTAISTWSSTPKTLNNSTVLLDASANITGVGTLKMLNKTGITDPNTLWINQLDGHLYRGATDVEADAGDVMTTIPLGTANDGYIIASSGTTGAYIKEAAINTTGGDLAILTPAKKIKMYDSNTSTVLPVLYSDGLSTNVGFSNGSNPNENTNVGQSNDTNNLLQGSVCIGNGNCTSLSVPSGDNVSCGHYNLGSLTSGNQNTCIGIGCYPNLTVGDQNIAVGTNAGQSLVTGTGVIYIGDSTGLASESFTTRIGYDATARTYIKGVYNQTVNNKAKITGITSSGVLEDANLFFDSSANSLCLTSSNVPAQNVGVLSNTIYGSSVLSVATTGTNNALYGRSLCTTCTTSCSNNTIYGNGSVVGPTSGIQNNTIVGSSCVLLNGATNISNTVVIGNGSAQNINGAVGCIIIGNASGNGMTSNANNIIIGGPGTAGRNNSIEIGISGTHSSLYLQGATASTLSNKKTMVMNSTTGQVGYEAPLCMCGMELSFENFASPYTRTLSIGTPTELQFTGTNLSNDPTNFDVTTPYRIKWLGATTTYFHCAFSMSGLLASGTNTDVEFTVCVNGVKVTNSAIRRRFASTTEWQMVTFHKVVQLAQNQYMSIFANNLSGSNSVNFGNINMVALEMMV